MRIGKFILILCISQCVLAQQKCSTIENLDQTSLWKLVRPVLFQNYFIVSVGSLSIIGLLLTLWTWKFYPSFSIPSDLMFAICCTQFLENISLLASSIYLFIHTEAEPPSDFSAACTTISIIFSMGNTGSMIYNTAFCVVLSLSIKKTLKGTLFSQPRYHAIVLLSIAAITAALAITGALGTSINGICGYRISNRESFARSICEIIIICICIFSMYMFWAKIPKNSYFQKASLFGYYWYYMACFCIIQLFSTIAYLVGNIACRAGYEYSSQIISVSITFGSCQSILLSYVLIFLRFSHPVVRLKVKRFFCPTYEVKLQEEQTDQDEESWLGSLLQSIKGSQILSFLTAILISFAEHEHKIQKSALISRFSFKKNYKVRLTQSITDEYILKRISNRESLIVQQKLDGLRSLDYKVTAYSIEVFSQMLSNEKDANIFHSFNIHLNIKLVKEKSYTNGGKSGEFFFGTYDHKFIIKTISQEEAELYRQKIMDFYDYFQNNPKSLIVKIFGLYKFVRNDITDEPVYIILMRNISPYDRKDQQRVYDIKGSEFHRSTIQQKKIENVQKLRNLTLKDEDFKKLQRKICIQPQYSTPLRQQLKKDAQFLGKMGVMDYSILIIKRRGKPRDENYKFQGNKLSELPCYEQKDLYYNIGIIDYLQSWTLKRKAERAFKTMITKKKVTVTSPKEYSHRLTEFIDQII